MMSNATWMADLQQYLTGLALKDVIIPGTHDSGTYDLGWTFAPDTPAWAPYAEWGSAAAAAALLAPIGLLGAAVVAEARNFSVAQDRPISDQLNEGIRYLDLRVAPDSQGDLYLLHGFWGPAVADVLGQVLAFLQANPQEIVILDFNHFYCMTPALHAQLAQLLQQTFGYYLPGSSNPKVGAGLMAAYSQSAASGYSPTTTVGTLWQNSARLVVLYGGDQSGANGQPNSTGVNTVLGNSAYPFLWPRSQQDLNPQSTSDAPVTIMDNWPNATNVEELISSIGRDYILNRVPDAIGTSQAPAQNFFYVTQGIITLNIGTGASSQQNSDSIGWMTSNPIAGLIGIGSTASPAVINSLLSWVGPPAQPSAAGSIYLNIIIVDAFEHSSIVELAKLLNLIKAGQSLSDLALVWSQMTPLKGGQANQVYFASAIDGAPLFQRAVPVPSVAANNNGVALAKSGTGIGATVVDDNTLFLAWTDATTSNIYIARTVDGATFVTFGPLSFPNPAQRDSNNNAVMVAATSQGTPALAYFREKLWVAWVDGVTHLYIADSTGDPSGGILEFTAPIPLPSNPSQMLTYIRRGPALGVVGEYLYVAFIGGTTVLSNTILIAWSVDGYHWMNNVVAVTSGSTVQSSNHEPVLVPVGESQFYLGWAGSGDGEVNYWLLDTLPDGTPVFPSTSPSQLNCGSDTEDATGGISMCLLEGALYVAWGSTNTSSYGQQVNVAVLNPASTSTGVKTIQPSFYCSQYGTPTLIEFVPNVDSSGSGSGAAAAVASRPPAPRAQPGTA